MTAEEQQSLFHRWLRDHLGLMVKVVRSCTASPQDQDDLFQEVLVNLWSSIPGFRGDSKETTWIYRVAFNTALSWRRGERRRRRKLEPLFDHGELAYTPSIFTTSNNGQEVVEKLYSAIRQLPQVDASVALMHLDGLSYHEIAEVLGISESYVGVKLHRIRQQLAEKLQGVSDEL